MNDLLVISRFKNNRMFQLIGDRTHVECAKLCGVSLATFSGILNLRISPFLCNHETNGHELIRFTEHAERIAAGLGEAPEDLYPPSLYALRVPHRYMREFDSQRVLSLSEIPQPLLLVDDTEQNFEQQDRNDALLAQLRTLTPREERVVKMRFGLGDEAPMSFDEIGASFGFTRSRAQQIETRALNKLRKPQRVARIAGHLQGCDLLAAKEILRKQKERIEAAQREEMEREERDRRDQQDRKATEAERRKQARIREELDREKERIRAEQQREQEQLDYEQMVREQVEYRQRKMQVVSSKIQGGFVMHVRCIRALKILTEAARETIEQKWDEEYAEDARLFQPKLMWRDRELNNTVLAFTIAKHDLLAWQQFVWQVLDNAASWTDLISESF